MISFHFTAFFMDKNFESAHNNQRKHAKEN